MNSSSFINCIVTRMNSCKEKNIGMERRRAWGDLCWDVLNSIYSNLPSDHYDPRLGFGSVCKNWHQFQAAAAAAAGGTTRNLQEPERTRFGNQTFHVGDRLERPNLEALWDRIPKRARAKLENSRIVYIWESGWWLLAAASSSLQYTIHGCFNPFLPSHFIPLPKLPFDHRSMGYGLQEPRIPAAAFSAPPTSSDWAIAVVHGRSDVATLRRGQGHWRDYTFRYDPGHAVGIGYSRGKLYVLFKEGGVLIVGGRGKQRMLVTEDLKAQMMSIWGIEKNLCVVEISVVAVSWRRVGERFRLLRVEEKEEDETEKKKMMEQSEEGRRTVVVFAKDKPYYLRH